MSVNLKKIIKNNKKKNRKGMKIEEKIEGWRDKT
jgi:hypothetical protein